MPSPRPFPVNVLVAEHGRIFAVRAENSVLSDSKTWAVVPGIGKYASKWLLVSTLAGRAMGEYFGHFKGREEAVKFMSAIDRLTRAPTISDGVVSGKFVRKWNQVCRKHRKPILTTTILLRYFLTTSRGKV